MEENPYRKLTEEETQEALELLGAVTKVPWVKQNKATRETYIIDPVQFLEPEFCNEAQYNAINEMLALLHATKEKGGKEAVSGYTSILGPLTDEARYAYIGGEDAPIRLNALKFGTLENLYAYAKECGCVPKKKFTQEQASHILAQGYPPFHQDEDKIYVYEETFKSIMHGAENPRRSPENYAAFQGYHNSYVVLKKSLVEVDAGVSTGISTVAETETANRLKGDANTRNQDESALG